MGDIKQAGRTGSLPRLIASARLASLSGSAVKETKALKEAAQRLGRKHGPVRFSGGPLGKSSSCRAPVPCVNQTPPS